MRLGINMAFWNPSGADVAPPSLAIWREGGRVDESKKEVGGVGGVAKCMHKRESGREREEREREGVCERGSEIQTTRYTATH